MIGSGATMGQGVRYEALHRRVVLPESSRPPGSSLELNENRLKRSGSATSKAGHFDDKSPTSGVSLPLLIRLIWETHGKIRFGAME